VETCFSDDISLEIEMLSFLRRKQFSNALCGCCFESQNFSAGNFLLYLYLAGLFGMYSYNPVITLALTGGVGLLEKIRAM